MKEIETYIVDSFTDQSFKGNPAGVCIVEEELSNSEMLSIAKELGLSETAFIGRINEDWRLAKETNEAVQTPAVLPCSADFKEGRVRTLIGRTSALDAC